MNINEEGLWCCGITVTFAVTMILGLGIFPDSNYVLYAVFKNTISLQCYFGL